MQTFLSIDYPIWWFLVVGAVFTGYAILDGFDLGAGALHLFFRKEESRRIALNAIGPVWDGNEVWLVIGGGALFAGFPEVYATIFSAFYIPFMLFLTVLILRAIAIEFRSKEKMLWWRKTWDITYSAASILISLLLGIVLGNVMQGIPINKDFEYEGGFFNLLNPYALITGVTVLALFMMHGATYLIMKTEKRLHTKLIILAKNTSRFFVISYVTLTMATLIYLPQTADKFRANPYLFIVPVLTILTIINTRRLLEKGVYFKAFLSSALTSALLLITVTINLFPNIVLSTIDPAFNITIYNGSSSQKSLGIMLTIAAIGVPLVAAYTTFVFWTFRGKVKMDDSSY
ncbi:MAG: cytochrome d ubiquinol oxidase subunit II [Chitinophagaceae bacterium]|nr:cytochrome d ubiquinol oxidase subunit II [Chitinophagaceae bacterium]